MRVGRKFACELIRDAFVKCTEPGGKMYALDWQHSAFLYDPRNIEEQQSVLEFEQYYHII